MYGNVYQILSTYLDERNIGYSVIQLIKQIYVCNVEIIVYNEPYEMCLIPKLRILQFYRHELC